MIICFINIISFNLNECKSKGSSQFIPDGSNIKSKSKEEIKAIGHIHLNGK